jgi:hypothetical protein
MTQGHTAIVLTFVSLFLITVTFIVHSCAPRRALAGRASRVLRPGVFLALPQAFDHHVHQPGAEGAVLFGVLRLLSAHVS